MQHHPAKTISEVIENLDQIIEDSLLNYNYLGIFAAVYQLVTISVKHAIEEGRFDDNERMHQFDVKFANLYLEAYQQYQNDQALSNVWKVAFDAKQEPLIILQHLFLGMHAHIDFDLGLAAGTSFQEAELQDFKNDFMKINDILKAMVEEVQEKLFKSSYLLSFLDWLAKKKDEQVANFSIVQTRNLSWEFACDIAELPASERATFIEKKQAEMTKISHIIRKPNSKIIQTIQKIMRWFEEKDPQKIIQKFRD